MTDLNPTSSLSSLVEAKAKSEPWFKYRARILIAFQQAGNEGRRIEESKVAFNRRVKEWAKSKETGTPQQPKRNSTESLRVYRERIRDEFYEAETLRSYRARMRTAEGKVAFNRRVKAWADGNPYSYIAPISSSARSDSQQDYHPQVTECPPTDVA